MVLFERGGFGKRDLGIFLLALSNGVNMERVNVIQWGVGSTLVALVELNGNRQWVKAYGRKHPCSTLWCKVNGVRYLL